MKDAYSFDRDAEGAKPATRSWRRPTGASSTASACATARWRPTAAPSVATERGVPGDCRDRRRRHRLLPDSDYAANMEKAEALAPQAGRARRPPADGENATPGKSTCADVAQYLGVPLQQTVKSLVLATETTAQRAGEIIKTRSGCCMLRGDHDMNEIKVNKVPGWRTVSALRPWPRSRTISAASPGTWACSGCASRCGWWWTARWRSWPTGFAAPTNPTSTSPASTGAATCPSRTSWPTCATWWPATVARWQGRAGDRARHRGGPCVLPRHQVQQGHERHLPGRQRQAAVHGDGLLRHWHHPPACRGHRAEP
jgi:prolyl-tRNA synthetase